MNSLTLVKTKKEYFSLFIVLAIIFLLNLFYNYIKYLDFKKDALFTTKAELVNIYPKEKYKIFKFKNDNITFFTSSNNEIYLEKLDYVEISLLTNNISFLDYLKGFYGKSFNIFFLENNSIKKKLSDKISSQHTNKDISEIYEAIFLAIPTNTNLRDIFAIYSISHLIAISGFHLSVLSALIYFIVYQPYSYFHNRYFPFRNKKFDILLFTLLVLFVYLIFTDLVPSLLRAFIMLCMGIYFLRCNIKVLSFETLLFTLVLIVAFFPKYLFSISLWFSIIGVFYIFLFIKYFKNGNKIVLILFFNFWIFASFNPIVHYFFGVTSWVQLLSPFITLVFTVFYPLSLFLHTIGYGYLLDELLLSFINQNFAVYDIITPLWFFILYCIVSLLSIFSKSFFVLLNILLLLFNIYLYI